MSKTRGIVLEPEVSRDVEPGVVTLYDMSRFINNGAMADVTWVQLPSGLWVMDFDGTDYVDVSDDNSLDVVSALSIEFWAKIPEGSTGYILSKNFGFEVQMPYSIRVEANIYRAVIENTSYSMTGVIADNLWHQSGFCWEGANMTPFLDGISLTPVAAAGPLTPNTYPLAIGCRNNNGVLPGVAEMTGCIGKLCIYNYALTPGQILQRFEATRRLFGV